MIITKSKKSFFEIIDTIISKVVLSVIKKELFYIPLNKKNLDPVK